MQWKVDTSEWDVGREVGYRGRMGTGHPGWSQTAVQEHIYAKGQGKHTRTMSFSDAVQMDVVGGWPA